MIAPAELDGSTEHDPRLVWYNKNNHIRTNIPLCILRVTEYCLQEFSSLGFKKGTKFCEGFPCADRVCMYLRVSFHRGPYYRLITAGFYRNHIRQQGNVGPAPHQPRAGIRCLTQTTTCVPLAQVRDKADKDSCNPWKLSFRVTVAVVYSLAKCIFLTKIPCIATYVSWSFLSLGTEDGITRIYFSVPHHAYVVFSLAACGAVAILADMIH